MPNVVTRHISNELYMAAGLLVLFGFAKTGIAGPSRPIQLVLAACCAGAAAVVRQGGPTGRLAGIAAAGATVAFGALCLWTGRGFVPGSIISVYALVRLFGCAEAFSVGGPAPAVTPQQFPTQPGAWQQTPGVHVVPASGSAGYVPPIQPAPGAWQSARGAWQPAPAQPTQWSPAELHQYFAPPAGEVPPPPPAR